MGSLGDDGSQYAAGAGREVEERGKPAGWAGAAVGQLGNRSCGPARIITGFLPAGGFLPQAKRLPVAGFPGSRDVGATGTRLRLAGVRPRSGDEPGAGQERYADHKRDGRPDQVMSLMNAPHHEMQRVRCAGHVENPGDDRQDASGKTSVFASHR